MSEKAETNDTKQRQLSEESLELIEKFEAQYNAIDRQLRKTIGGKRETSFVKIINDYELRRRSFSKEANFLRMVGRLRNVIVHEKTHPYQYLAFPNPMVIEKMEKILQTLIDPPLAIPTFQRSVYVVSNKDSLAEVLKEIASKNYSQFPVYDNGSLKGLLTENGITRWLAQHVSTELSLIEFDEILVEEVLKEEEERPNYVFISRKESVDEIKEMFANSNMLEAVLITETGNVGEKLMGIATRWDVFS